MNHRTSIAAGLLGLGVSLVISAPWTFAQGNDGPGDAPGASNNAPRRLRINRNGGENAARIADSLNLTADQRTKFDAEMRDYQEKMRALRDEHDRKLSGILTPDQMTQYRSSQRNRGFGGPGGGQGAGGAGQGANGGRRGGRLDPQQMVQQMKTELNLTADQESQITKILEDARTRMQNLRSTANSTNDPNARREQMRSIRQEQNDKISAVLTTDQRTKWQTMQQNRRGGRRGGNARQ